MKNILITLSFLIGLVVMGEAQNFEWANSMGAGGNDAGAAMTIDASGNIYVAGGFSGTTDFDPSANTFNLTSTGGSDVFIQKLDPNGNLIWVRVFGSTSSDQSSSIISDSLGHIYITGSVQGVVDFDPGPGTFIPSALGQRDVFIQKLDTAGNFIWAKRFGGSDFEQSSAIITDGLGHLYTTGNFQGIADFDPGPGIFNMTASSTAFNIFIQKLDTAGNFIWAKSFGGGSHDFGRSIATDAVGNIYTTGSYGYTVDFDPGPGIFNMTTNGQQNAFIQKLDTAGNFIWVKTMGGTTLDEGSSITADGLGNIYVTGYFAGTVDFDPSAGISNLTSGGFRNSFVEKLDTAGNLIWAKAMLGTTGGEGKSLLTDALGNVYTVGKFSTTTDFDPNAGIFNLVAAGSSDVFIQKLDPNGTLIWAKSVGGIGDDWVTTLRIDLFNNIYLTGAYQDTLDFDPSTNTFNLNSNGGYDIFVLKLSQCSPSTSTDLQTACNSFTWIDGNTYTSNNNSATFNILGSATNGCDSLITLDLIINVPAASIDSIVTCNSYVWIDGNTYIANNNSATFNIIGGAATGCDSLISLDLTILPSPTGMDTRTECSPFVWIDGNSYAISNNSATFNIIGGAATGCDSLVSLDLTILPSPTGMDTRTECSPFVWIDGNSYVISNNSATFNIIGGASNGCDSLVTLDLIINTIDITVTTTDSNITSNTSGATYQWLDCDSNNIVMSGAIFQSFIASENGNYAVQVTENGCTDTSACVTILSVGIIKITPFFNSISIFPNPSEGTVNIDLGDLTEISLKVIAVSGQVIYTEENIRSATHKFELNVAAGIYFVEIMAQNKHQHYKLIIK
jgi:hypothetical protein